MRKRYLLTAFAVAMLFFATHAYAAGPQEALKANIDKVIAILTDPALKSEQSKDVKIDKIRSITDRMFDWTELARRSLGPDWRKLNEKQQNDFTTLYKKLLEKVYMDQVLSYAGEKIVYDSVDKQGDDKAEVRTSIATSSKKIPVNYRLLLENSEWRIYDVVIEGVSLVSNYRSQFRNILSGGSFEDLMKKLSEKVSAS